MTFHSAMLFSSIFNTVYCWIQDERLQRLLQFHDSMHMFIYLLSASSEEFTYAPALCDRSVWFWSVKNGEFLWRNFSLWVGFMQLFVS